MSDEQVIRYCEPTLASIKPASFFSSVFRSRQEMTAHIRSLNLRLREKGLRILGLSYRDGRGLIYVYRPAKLSADLQNELASALLKDCGYPCSDENGCLRCLIKRLETQAEFPHEIGLFLGLPAGGCGRLHPPQGRMQVLRNLESLRRRGTCAEALRPLPKMHGYLLPAEPGGTEHRKAHCSRMTNRYTNQIPPQQIFPLFTIFHIFSITHTGTHLSHDSLWEKDPH